MQNLHLKVKVIVLFALISSITASFACFPSYIIPDIRNNSANFNDLKPSAGEITIITPEQKVYTDPMSGYYPATYGFEDEDSGTLGTAINFVDGTTTPLEYIYETGWWMLEEGEGSTAEDTINGDQNGTIYGATWTSDSKLGDNALHFDGIDDYIDVDYNLPNNDYSICAWYKSNGSGYQEIVAEGLGGESQGTNVQELLLHSDTEIRFKTETGSGINHDYIFTVAGNLTDGQWHFIGAVITTGMVVVYWDDQKFNTTSFINSDTRADNCWIGCYGGPGTGTWFDGVIDDVRIYECPLSGEEMLWLYNNGKGRDEILYQHSHRTGWWMLEEGEGSTAEDTINGDQNGTIYGATWTIDSKLGDYALQFDGIDDYIDVYYDLPNVGYSICAWYKSSGSGYQEIVAEGLGGESQRTNVQELLLHSDTEIRFKTETGSGQDHDYIFPVSGNLTDGQWHFIAAVIRSGRLDVYWDDQKFTTTSFITSDTRAGNCWIGCYGGPGTGTWFDGVMDDVRIYELILSDEEIEWIYNNGNGRSEIKGKPGGEIIDIIEQFNGHNKVLRLNDSKKSDYAAATNLFASTQTSGIIEFWISTTTSLRTTNVYLRDNLTIAVCVLVNNGKWMYHNGSFQDTGLLVSNNMWYHHKIVFDCITDTFDWYINRVKIIENGGFSNTLADIDNICFATSNYDSEYTTYVDAVGYSWDPNYNSGDNSNEGLLLSYDSTISLNWTAFSLDGIATRTISGNTTILMPSDGLHSIQVFGNDSVETMYQSDVRYFTVVTGAPDITINAPTDSEFFGTAAPAYDLSINGVYETIWYTLDGGATNITTSELMGAINQVEWNKFSDGIVTITFYANNSGGFIGSAEIMVVKHITVRTPPAIPGYNIIAILGLCCVISLLLIKQKIKN